MSRENVLAVLGLLERLDREGIEAGAAALDPAIEWDISAHPLPDFPDRGSGRDAFMRHIGEYFAGWLEYESRPEEVLDAGEHVVVVLHERTRMRASDAVLERSLPQVWTVRDGACVCFRVFRDREQALEAVGRSAGEGVASVDA
jgi:ketosteroid isomerase-like protein